jgi:hypothetical protein
MKREWTAGTRALAIATVLAVPVLEAKPKGPTHSPAHDAAAQAKQACVAKAPK